MLKNNYNFSSSVKKVFSNLYIADRNIPFAPNIVGVISFVSEIINRTEKWGIFLAKYNPRYMDFFLGMDQCNLLIITRRKILKKLMA